MNCDHSFISYDPDHPFLCKECKGTWGYHPHDKVAIDALVDKVMCSYVKIDSSDQQRSPIRNACDNIAKIDSSYCAEHSKRVVRLWEGVKEVPKPPGNPGSPPA